MYVWYRLTLLGIIFVTSYIWSVGAFILFYSQKLLTQDDPLFQVALVSMYVVTVLLLFARLGRKKVFARAEKKEEGQKGFTMIELMVVISIIGILTAILLPRYSSFRQKAYLAKAKAEFRSIETSLELYFADNLEYPADANRDVPPGLEDYLAPGIWPGASWPESVLDWDNWNIGGEQVYQISIRFCDVGGGNCSFPEDDWAEEFDAQSAVFYCLEGPCQSHSGAPADHPGYCVNCEDEFPHL